MLGQVALEEESGKATNGLGFAVVDRGPRELLELAHARAGGAVRRADRPRRVPRGVGLTEPGAGSDLAGAHGDGRPRRRRLGAERREVVRHERGRRPASTSSLAVARGRADAVPRRAGRARARDRAHARLPARPVPRPPPRDRLPRLPGAGREPRPGGGDAGAKEWILVERLFIAARCCGAARAAARPRERLGAGARGVRRADRRVPGRVVPARRLAHGAPRRAPAHVPRRARVRHARRPQDRPRQGRRWRSSTRPRWPGGSPTARCRSSAAAATCIENPAARFYRELRVDRIWEGTSEIQRLIIASGLFKRGAAPYLGWE